MSNIRIVLVETTHPGNIGAVARAMKNMCLSKLYLVEPRSFPNADATARASGADDLLSSAVTCKTLSDAISDCEIVIGASARLRTIEWPCVSPRECAESLLSDAGDKQVAIVFGRENSGLKNEELDLCSYLLNIPCNKEYSSLNIAAAVQVVCYELFVSLGEKVETVSRAQRVPLANSEQMELFYQHLYQALCDIGFMHPDKSRSIMRRLRRLYHRTRLDTRELDILRGILRMSQGKKTND